MAGPCWMQIMTLQETTNSTQHKHSNDTSGSGQLEDDWSQSFANACVGLLKYDKGDIKRLVVIGTAGKCDD